MKVMARKSIHEFSLSNELILFDESSNRLFRINGTAMAIWKGILAELSPVEIRDALCDLTGGHGEQIMNDINELLDRWRSLGLVMDVESQELIKTSLNSQTSVTNDWGDSTLIPAPAPGSLEFYFEIADTLFRLQVPGHEEYSLIMPLLNHLAAPAETGKNVTLSLVKDQGRYLLVEDSKVIDWCQNSQGIAPMVHANTALIAYERAECLMGLHAAAVARNGKVLLISGTSGAGKSTLTAALSGSGWSYLSDDLVLLTHKPLAIRAIPVGIGLKSGSWCPIQSYFPIVSNLPTHLRPDGKTIRYLVPPIESTRLGKEWFSIDIVLFPQFVEGGRVQLEPIKAIDGLCRLTSAGYDVPGGLDVPSVEQMIEWIAKIPCYEITFGNLADAVAALGDLLS